MKQIRLSVKEHRLTNKYNPTFKHYDYVKAFDFENEDDIELIYETVNLYVHTYYEYKDNTRNERSFKSASAIFLDFDGKDGHNDSTIAEFLDSDFSKAYNWIFYTSKSHIADVQECFHVIIPLDEKITDIPTLKATYASIFKEVEDSGLRCDTTVRDGARLIFPSLNESHDDDEAHFDNFQFEMHHEGSYLKAVKPTEIDVVSNPEVAVLERTHRNNDEDDEVSDYVREFNRMSVKSKYAYVKNMVKFINYQNRKSGFEYLTYNRWIGVGYTLYKTFGRTKGKKLFRMLSSGHPSDTIASVDRQFDYLCGCNFKTNRNLEILIQMTSAIGFRHTMYFRYYFMSKHRFNPTTTAVLYGRMLRELMNDNGFVGPTTNVKIYDYSFKKNTRTFLMEYSYEGEVYHVSVTLSEMMDIMANILNIPRKFVTTAITKGVIRRFININGVYDITRYIKKKIMTLLLESEGDYVRVGVVNDILRDIRDYSPSTIHNLITNKNIELYFFELGIFTDKRKKRFVLNGSNKPYMGYKVDKSKIVLSDRVSIPKTVYYTNFVQPTEVVAPITQRSVVMRC